MQVGGVSWRTIRVGADGWSVEVIDQRLLPHRFQVARLVSLQDAADAIRSMTVRGAPLIGATAAYGVALALRVDASDESLVEAAEILGATRPTAINLAWALDAAVAVLGTLPPDERLSAAYRHAAGLCDDDVATNSAIGEHGLALIRAAWRRRHAAGAARVNILTHCNAGWLATVDWGTALAPVYKAHAEGIPVHVWVDETRPRNQGAALTAWELGQAGIPHTVVVDSASGHLMQRGLVDLCFVGTDRTTSDGDVANKIGTYPTALAARDNGVPFYVCVPGPSIDWSLANGQDIPIEVRADSEVLGVEGVLADGSTARVRIAPTGTMALNPAFDVTPARLVTGLVTERGIAVADRRDLARLYPEMATERAGN
ncbi:MAG: S-methyl-5-thioribose-1-phosphate isomerase [Alphaproteobacteria bacterium]|nr:S-methyl-5-thioribose-1-phosphate isomerase [Alphaproteobacteria bacterium]